MAGSFANDLENYALDGLFGSAGIAVLTQYLALYTAAPTDAGGGTECTGGSYARLEIEAATGRVWSAASGGSISNSADWSFVDATASWGTVVAMGILSASAAGTLHAWADVTTSKAVGSGDTAKFPSGSLVITLD